MIVPSFPPLIRSFRPRQSFRECDFVALVEQIDAGELDALKKCFEFARIVIVADFARQVEPATFRAIPAIGAAGSVLRDTIIQCHWGVS